MKEEALVEKAAEVGASDEPCAADEREGADAMSSRPGAAPLGISEGGAVMHKRSPVTLKSLPSLSL